MSDITFTPEADQKIKELCDREGIYAISLNLNGGGCAGFKYEWGAVEYETDLEDGDEVFETESGGRMVVGVDSLVYMFGSVINYTESFMSSSFEIINPNAQNSCGCGTSVNF